MCLLEVIGNCKGKVNNRLQIKVNKPNRGKITTRTRGLF